MDVLKDSLADCPQIRTPETEVRYKLIIDPSEDDFLIRYLFKYGILAKKKTRTFICSDFFEDSEIQKVCYEQFSNHSSVNMYYYSLTYLPFFGL